MTLHRLASPAFFRNKANISTLLAHLTETDSLFIPILSSRVNLLSYALKLHSCAERLEAWDGDVLVGLVAVYCNANSAFISTVSVLPSWQHQGVARRLMQQCLNVVSHYQLPFVLLEVSNQAMPAIALYLSLGFEPQEMTGERLTMRLNLSCTSITSPG